MCYQCYEENYGAPKNITPAARLAAAFVNQIYETQLGGGHAHIVVDDWNLEDEHIRWCLEQPKEKYPDITDEEFENENFALRALLVLPMNERASAMALHEGWIK